MNLGFERRPADMEERAVPEGKYSVTVYTAIRDQRCVSFRVLDHIPGSVEIDKQHLGGHHRYMDAVQILEFERQNFPRSRAVRAPTL